MAKKGQKDICRWLRRQRCKVFCGVVIFQVFVGNIDNDSTKSNLFDPPIVAQYIRIIPLVCRRACTLRMELVGCELNGKALSFSCPVTAAAKSHLGFYTEYACIQFTWMDIY